MTVHEYRERLFMALAAFDRSEVENVIDYYTELIEDAENPESEMNRLGTPEQLAAKIIQENGWVQPDPENTGEQNGGFTPPPPQPNQHQSGWTAGRIIALVLTAPFWIAGYAIMLALFAVIMAVYFACAAAFVTSITGAFQYITTYLPFSAELACVAIMMAGLVLLLFRPAKALFRGVGGLTADYSYFLFVPGRIREKHRSSKPINKLIVLLGAVMLAVGIIGTAATDSYNTKSTESYLQSLDLESYEQPLDGSLDNISFSINNGNITVFPTDDGKAKLVCENVNRDNLKIEDSGRLKISYKTPKLKSSRISFGSLNKFTKKTQAKFTLYLPESQLNKLKLHSDLGDVNVNGLKVSSLNLDCSCGDIKLSGVSSDTLTVTSDLGATTLENSSFADMDVTADCGEVKLISTECTGKLLMNESLGDIKVNDCTFNTLSIENNCGDIDFKSTTLSGSSTFTNDLGDIELSLIGSDYGISATVDLGDITINDKDDHYTSGSVPVIITCSTGDIDVDFQ